MKEVLLTQGFVALVDDEDYERVVQFKWRASPRRYTCYAQRSFRYNGSSNTFTELMHCFILRTTGVDHINGNGLNNQKLNLRKATQHQNNGNYKKRKGNSKYKGVCINTPASNWKAQIRKGDKKYYLGSFKTEEEAAKAYDVAAKEYFGEFAQLNFPEGENG